MPGSTWLANGKPRLNPGHLTPEYTLSATLQNTSLQFRITVGFKRLILKAPSGTSWISTEKEIRDSKRETLGAILWLSPHASPIQELMGFCSREPASVYLTLHLMEPLSITPHHNQCDRDFCGWGQLRSALRGPLYLSTLCCPGQKESFSCCTCHDKLFLATGSKYLYPLWIKMSCLYNDLPYWFENIICHMVPLRQDLDERPTSLMRSPC